MQLSCLVGGLWWKLRVHLSSRILGSRCPGVIWEAGRADSLAVWNMQSADGVQSATGTTISPWINLHGRDCPIADWFIATMYKVFKQSDDKPINRQSSSEFFMGCIFLCLLEYFPLSCRQSVGWASAIQCLPSSFLYLPLLFFCLSPCVLSLISSGLFECIYGS